jgi:hypothetical protein
MDEEFRTSVVQGFEAGTWPVTEWRHMHHLVIAVQYIRESADPMTALRDNIRRYNVSQGTRNTEDSGYHETITRFWLHVITSYMASLPPDLSTLDITVRVVDEFTPKRDLFRQYYDFDVVKSKAARAEWIPPARGI